MSVRWMGIFLIAGVAGISSGCRSVPSPNPVRLSPPALDVEHSLGVDDIIEVRVYGEVELSQPYRIGVDGTIVIPLIGRQLVAGLTTVETEDVITHRLREGQFLNEPHVSVFLKENNSRRVNVIGQVVRPGPVPYTSQMTVLDAISNAGGFSAIADKNSVKLTRYEKGLAKTVTCRVADISEGRAPNVSLRPGDVVVVDERIF